MRDKWLRTLYALVIIGVWAFLMILDGLSETYSAPLVLTPLMLVPAGAIFGLDSIAAAFRRGPRQDREGANE